MALDMFFNKWLHLLSMIGALGGLIFALIVLITTNPGTEGTEAHWKRFGRAQGMLWLVVMVTGFYNMMKVTPSVNGHYQMFLGIKMMFAILMFIVSMMMAHPGPGKMGKLAENRRPVLQFVILLGVIIVGLSAYLNISRINGSGLKPKTTTAATSGEPNEH